jgi:hypothetical protein
MIIYNDIHKYDCIHTYKHTRTYIKHWYIGMRKRDGEIRSGSTCYARQSLLQHPGKPIVGWYVYTYVCMYFLDRDV